MASVPHPGSAPIHGPFRPVHHPHFHPGRSGRSSSAAGGGHLLSRRLVDGRPGGAARPKSGGLYLPLRLELHGHWKPVGYHHRAPAGGRSREAGGGGVSGRPLAAGGQHPGRQLSGLPGSHSWPGLAAGGTTAAPSDRGTDRRRNHCPAAGRLLPTPIRTKPHPRGKIKHVPECKCTPGTMFSMFRQAIHGLFSVRGSVRYTKAPHRSPPPRR